MLPVNSNLEVRSSDTEQMTDREGKVRSADLREDERNKGASGRQTGQTYPLQNQSQTTEKPLDYGTKKEMADLKT